MSMGNAASLAFQSVGLAVGLTCQSSIRLGSYASSQSFDMHRLIVHDRLGESWISLTSKWHTCEAIIAKSPSICRTSALLKLALVLHTVSAHDAVSYPYNHVLPSFYRLHLPAVLRIALRSGGGSPLCRYFFCPARIRGIRKLSGLCKFGSPV